jgi:hypothetical protein
VLSLSCVLELEQEMSIIMSRGRIYVFILL